MLPTLILCTQLTCYAISIERVAPSYIECETHFSRVEEYVRELQLTNVLYRDSFVSQRECRER
jgi:hypothetical protein